MTASDEEDILLEDIIDCANRISNWNDNAKVKEKIREQLAEAIAAWESWKGSRNEPFRV